MGAKMMPMAKKSGRTVLGVRMGLFVSEVSGCFSHFVSRFVSCFVSVVTYCHALRRCCRKAVSVCCQRSRSIDITIIAIAIITKSSSANFDPQSAPPDRRETRQDAPGISGNDSIVSQDGARTRRSLALLLLLVLRVALVRSNRVGMAMLGRLVVAGRHPEGGCFAGLRLCLLRVSVFLKVLSRLCR